MSKVKCGICPRGCTLKENEIGFCKARKYVDGEIKSENYGIVTSISLDPIEKKPLNRFYPNSQILSVGSYGCNFRCQFCQNHQISMADRDNVESMYISSENLVKKAEQLKQYGNIGIAFTYNEPFIGYEYIYDTAKIAITKDLKIVIVTNGYICEKPLLKLLPYVSAMNIDLKGFTDEFYNSVSGNLETVKNTIQISHARCHIEITTLIIPDLNDSEYEIEQLSKWIASVDKNIPLHISRFFPRYHMNDVDATPVEKVYRLAEIANRYLEYVYVGNV